MACLHPYQTVGKDFGIRQPDSAASRLNGNTILTSLDVDVLRKIPNLFFSVERIVIIGMHDTSVVELHPRAKIRSQLLEGAGRLTMMSNRPNSLIAS